MIDRPTRLDQRTTVSRGSITVGDIVQPSRTTPFEQFMLSTAIIVSPLQNYIPTVAGMSVSFLIFAALAAYTFVNRLRSLGDTWCHPIFIAAYIFIGVSIMLEFSSPLSRYETIVRFGQMIGGAVCVAALCRDRSALTAGLYAYVATALWVSVVLFLTSYGTLQGMPADDFNQASKLRAQAFEDNPIQTNINGMAFICAQGAIVAFALSLSTRLKQRRIPLLGIATFCLIAAFLPMSRGAAVISLVSFVAILYAHGVKHGKALILASILGMGVYAVVPDAVWSRMAFSTETREGGKMEGRAYIYTKALNYLPEYILAGVGSGNYYRKWGAEKGFMRASGNVLGAHNAFLQVAIFWGALGLLLFLWIVWVVYRSIPLRCGRDELSLALLGILVSLGLWLMETHGFSDKSFAYGVGMLVGARRWIWPTGVVSDVEVKQRPLPHRI